VLAAAGADRVLSGGAGHLADGELLDLADTPIRVHATPGTDPNHLAFELPEMGVVLVGDLEGGGASRTIPEPVDETALRRSRERIAGLGRAARLPAHDREGR
jgi:glyoxylase-like metal-dependent hydrolase (beta-lactamase superfamily II)